jgi:hypothetical protein
MVMTVENTIADAINGEWIRLYGGKAVTDSAALVNRIKSIAQDRDCWVANARANQDQYLKLLPTCDIGSRYRIEFDGFVGTVIGSYRRTDGEDGVVLQQDGTKVVHVYRRKWLIPA